MEIYKKDDNLTCNSCLSIPAGIVGNSKYKLDSTSILAYSIILESYSNKLVNSDFCVEEINIESIKNYLGISMESALMAIKSLEEAGLLKRLSA